MKILLETTTSKLEIKKSKFITIATPCKDLNQVKEIVNKTKKEHPNANHVVHSAVLGATGTIFSFSDDGEPKNTSGRPSFEILKASHITNIIILIIRYFGGTKLGTGGLVKAYGDSTKEVLRKVKTEELIKKSSFILKTSYDRYEKNKLRLLEKDCIINNEEFTINVTVKGTIASSKTQELKKEIIDKSNARDEIFFEEIELFSC